MSNREWCEEHGEDFNRMNDEHEVGSLDPTALKPCPCGAVPGALAIYDIGQGGKWAMCYGDCCSEWHIEFRTGYAPLDSDECMQTAIEAWNSAPRGA